VVWMVEIDTASMGDGLSDRALALGPEIFAALGLAGRIDREGWSIRMGIKANDVAGAFCVGLNSLAAASRPGRLPRWNVVHMGLTLAGYTTASSRTLTADDLRIESRSLDLHRETLALKPAITHSDRPGRAECPDQHGLMPHARPVQRDVGRRTPPPDMITE
jgi:hypothetical protein